MSTGQKRTLSLFFILLWGQLIFSVGLSLWRTEVIVFENGTVFPGNNAPGIVEFIAFAEENCPGDSTVFYITSKYQDFALVRYTLYPMPVNHWTVNLSSPTALNDLRSKAMNMAKDSQMPLCLFIDYLEAELPEMGERLWLNDEQFLVILSE